MRQGTKRSNDDPDIWANMRHLAFMNIETDNTYKYTVTMRSFPKMVYYNMYRVHNDK